MTLILEFLLVIPIAILLVDSIKTMFLVGTGVFNDHGFVGSAEIFESLKNS